MIGSPTAVSRFPAPPSTHGGDRSGRETGRAHGPYRGVGDARHHPACQGAAGCRARDSGSRRRRARLRFAARRGRSRGAGAARRLHALYRECRHAGTTAGAGRTLSRALRLALGAGRGAGHGGRQGGAVRARPGVVRAGQGVRGPQPLLGELPRAGALRRRRAGVRRDARRRRLPHSRRALPRSASASAPARCCSTRPAIRPAA